jgi:hypothetical protein
VAVVSMAAVEAASTVAALAEADFAAVVRIAEAEAIVVAAALAAGDIMAEVPTEVVRSEARGLMAEAPAALRLVAGPQPDSGAALALAAVLLLIAA